MDNYHIFELVRQSKDGGGGLALGCLQELQPAWVREGDDQVEALSVEIMFSTCTAEFSYGLPGKHTGQYLYFFIYRWD